MVGQSVHWLVGQLVSLSVGWLVSRLVGRSVADYKEHATNALVFFIFLNKKNF